MNKLLTVAAVALLAAGCLSGKGAYNIHDVDGKSSLPAEVSPAKMEEIIVQAGLERDWVAEKKAPGKVTLVLDVRGKHKVVVDVVYSGREYEVKFVSADNMRYDPADGSISGKYVQWVRNLIKDIRLIAAKGAK